MTATLIDAPPANTPEWVEWRKGGLGASDLAAAMGLDPYVTEHELWEVKTGRAPAFTGNAKTRWGHRMEQLGIEWWKENTENVREEPYGWDRPMTDARWPHLWATPDGLGDLWRTPRLIGIEVKVTNAWVHPPERVRVQALAQMGLGHLERVDVVRLNFDDDPAIFRIERDEAAIEAILGAGEAWYVHHVIEGVEPPRRADEAPADERQAALAADLRQVRKAIAQLERQEAAIKDDLIASVAGAGVITGQGFRIEVRAAHDTTRTGWKDAMDDLRIFVPPDEWDAAVKANQTTSRVRPAVYPKWDEEES